MYEIFGLYRQFNDLIEAFKAVVYEIFGLYRQFNDSIEDFKTFFDKMKVLCIYSIVSLTNLSYRKTLLLCYVL